jgi:hypothetical protein
MILLEEFLRFVLLILLGLFVLSPTAKAEQGAKPTPSKHVLIKDNSPRTPFYLLKPNTTLESTLYGVCKRVTNHTEKALVYIPTGSNTWPDYSNRRDQNGFFAIEVKPCD